MTQKFSSCWWYSHSLQFIERGISQQSYCVVFLYPGLVEHALSTLITIAVDGISFISAKANVLLGQ